MATGDPVPLKLSRDLLTQPRTRVRHRDPERMALHGWLVVKNPGKWIVHRDPHRKFYLTQRFLQFLE